LQLVFIIAVICFVSQYSHSYEWTNCRLSLQ